jgi:hypothetical protein
VEEVGRLRVAVLLRLVNLVPNVVNVGIDNLTDSLEVIASVIEISQHKQ